MKRLLTLLVLTLLATALAAPPMGLEQKVVPDGEPVPFGKPVELILTLRYPSEIEPPAADTLEVPDVHVLDRFSVKGPNDGSNSSIEYHIFFTRLEPGAFVVPEIQVGSATSSAVKVDFVGAKPLESDEEGEVRGPKSVEELSTADFWKQALTWLAGTLGTLLVLWWLLNRLGILDRLRSPKGRALKRLKRLRKGESTAEGLLLGSVEVLRRYLHEAYGFTTAEATSKEILNQMTMDNRCRELKDSVQGFLEAGDGVKFARQSLGDSEASDHYENLVHALSAEPKVKS